MAKFVIYKPMAQNQPSMDSYGFFESEGGSFLAFVSDAPIRGNIDTGASISKFFELFSNTILNRVKTMRPEEISLLVADIMTSLNEYLYSKNIEINRTGGAISIFQSTCSMVLAYNGILYSLAYGDSPVYFVGNDKILRLSDSTRARNLLFNADNPPSEEIIEYNSDPPHYIGVEKFCFSHNDVIQIPTKGNKFIIMASDGGEKDLSLQVRNIDFYRDKNIKQLEDSLNQIMSHLNRYSDDITLLVIEALDSEVFADIVARRLETAETSIKDIINDCSSNNEKMNNILAALSECTTEARLKTSHEELAISIKKIDSDLAEFRDAYKMKFQKVNYRIDYLMKKEKEYNIMQEEINYRMSNLDSTIEQAVNKQIGKIQQFSEHNKNDKEPAGEMLALHGPDIPSGPNKEDSHSKKQKKAAKRKSEKKTPKNVQGSNKYMYIIYWLIILLLLCLVAAAIFRKPLRGFLFPESRPIDVEVFIMYVPEENVDVQDEPAVYDTATNGFDPSRCYKINIRDYGDFKSKKIEITYTYTMGENENIAEIKERYCILGPIDEPSDGKVKVPKLQYHYKIIDEELDNYEIIQEIFDLEDFQIEGINLKISYKTFIR